MEKLKTRDANIRSFTSVRGTFIWAKRCDEKRRPASDAIKNSICEWRWFGKWHLLNARLRVQRDVFAVTVFGAVSATTEASRQDLSFHWITTLLSFVPFHWIAVTLLPRHWLSRYKVRFSCIV